MSDFVSESIIKRVPSANGFNETLKNIRNDASNNTLGSNYNVTTGKEFLITSETDSFNVGVIYNISVSGLEESNTYSYYFEAYDALGNQAIGEGTSEHNGPIVEEMFTEVMSTTFTGVRNSSSTWGDYDNDGDLDLLITGSDGQVEIAKIYSNHGDGVFIEESGIVLAGISMGSAEWGDYDNDGDLDILMAGSYLAKIYKNEGNNQFTEQTQISLPGLCFTKISVALGRL